MKLLPVFSTTVSIELKFFDKDLSEDLEWSTASKSNFFLS